MQTLESNIKSQKLSPFEYVMTKSKKKFIDDSEYSGRTLKVKQVDHKTITRENDEEKKNLARAKE